MNVQTTLQLLSWKKFGAMFLILIGCFTGIYELQKTNIGTIKSEQTERIYKQQAQKATLNLQILSKIPSFGFDNLLADWIFLRFIQYQGDRQARSITGYSLNPKYFKAIVERDRRFLSAYFLLSPATSLFAASPEVSVELIEKGAKKISPQQFSRAYYLWFDKGRYEVLFLRDIPEAIRSYEMAEKWASFQETKEAKRRVEDAKEMIKLLKEDPISKKVQVNAWESTLSYAPDQATRDLVINKIRQLGGEITVTSEGELKDKLPESSE